MIIFNYLKKKCKIWKLNKKIKKLTKEKDELETRIDSTIDKIIKEKYKNPEDLKRACEDKHDKIKNLKKEMFEYINNNFDLVLSALKKAKDDLL